jgi:hypothetical protein
MKRMLVILSLAGVLGGCGADGEPVQPSMNSTIYIDGSGVSAATGVSLRKGPFTLGVSL